MTMMWPLPVEGKLLDVAARVAQLTGLVTDAARDGLPAHELERGLWHYLLRLGHELQAEYFALAGDGDCGETLTLADGRGVKRLPEPHGRPYRSIFGDFTLERVMYGTREGQRIEAVPLEPGWGCRTTSVLMSYRTGIRRWWWRIPTPKSMRCWSASWVCSSRWPAWRR